MTNSTSSGFHVYGAKAALKVEPDRTAQGFPTVALEAAHGSPGLAYAWDRKIRFQVTERELPALLLVLLRRMTTAEFQYHGERRDKAMQIKQTPDGIVVRLKGTGGDGQVQRFAVRLPVEGVFQFAAIALQQLASGYGLSDSVTLALLSASVPEPNGGMP